MMDISIKQLEESNVTLEDVLSLIKDVFLEREKEGIHVSYVDFTLEDIKEHTKDAVVFVAVDDNTDKIVGTVTLRLFKNQEVLKDYGYEELLAVSSSVQRLGVGARLIQAEKAKAEEIGLKFIKSDTSIKAVSSVYFHKKQGYMIDGYQSSGLTNTYSYTFRLPIKRSFKTTRIYCKARFLLFYIIIRLSKDSKGNYYPLGKLLRELRVIS